MKKFNKIISLLLAVMMLIGSLTTVFAINVSAEEADTDTDTDTNIKEDDSVNIIVTKTPEDYTEKIYATEDEKLATMKLAFRNHGYEIYVDDYSGEVVIVNLATGEKLFTNPWDVAADKSSNSTTDDSTSGSIKESLLSQIELTFTDITGHTYTYTSFRMASQKNQVVVKNIKNGIRVEYTIGREQAKLLVPHSIEPDRFNKLIKEDIIEGMKVVYGEWGEWYANQFLVYYQPVSRYEINLETGEFVLDENGERTEKSDTEKKKLFEDFPALKEIDVIYVLDQEISQAELIKLEQSIKTHCPDYSYEELDYDHERTKYEALDENSPVFKMALEYTIDEQGLTVRLPANGMRFNESLYTLNSLVVLPYMGAGSNWCDGYNFMPDGSGAIYEFDSADVSTTPVNVYNQVYGNDFAYHELMGTYEKTIRYPVFGTVENSKEYKITTKTLQDEVVTFIDGSIYDRVKSYDPTAENSRYQNLYELYGSLLNSNGTIEVTEKKSGFLAIVEEGDALTMIASYHGGNQNDYNSVKMQFTPRPSDTYNLQESISVSGLGERTVVSDRKYLGSYKIRYIMLSDADKAAENGKTVYDASWLGMAAAYRDYLTNNGIIQPLSENDVDDDIPLYIESFGALETVERILSIPVTRMTALTTFEDVITMYDDLSEEGITNINFKLTGFANGGMYYTVPKNLKFERVVGKNKGFQALLDYAARKEAAGENFGVFPDFDFAYIINETSFDGVSRSKHASKTIDDRYASKRVYSATQQKYINYYDLVISPAYFEEFYEKLVDKYLKYENLNGISLGSLGNALNSDFDEDEPYNREDSKEYTVEALEYITGKLGEDVEMMTSGGNAYTWKYADHILDVALDSSRQSRSSNAVPFIGVVLHGSIQFAGEPLNMEGDMQYAMLKAIENGASPYFVLSYRNTDSLKEDSYLSKYYSIRYDIWKDDLVSTYETLNEALSDVQTKYIIDHQFVEGERIPDIDEIEADILDAIKDYVDTKNNLEENELKELELSFIRAREEGRIAEAYVIESVIKAAQKYISLENSYIQLQEALEVWKESRDEDDWEDVHFAFISLCGATYRDLKKIVADVEDYVESTEAAIKVIEDDERGTDYILNEAKDHHAVVRGYFENNRLVRKSVYKINGREVTLLPQSEWIESKPTYAYGFVESPTNGIEGGYLYAVGSAHQGYSIGELNEFGGLNTISYVSGIDEVLEGEKIDLDEFDVYIEGEISKQKNLTVYKAVTESGEEVYYSKVSGYNVYYEYQMSYKDMLASSTEWIDEILDSMASEEEAYASLKALYDESMNYGGVGSNDDKVDEEETSKYIVENIVVVTYGDESGAYKHLILNYNDFAVKVKFNSAEYTISGYDFVSVID